MSESKVEYLGARPIEVVDKLPTPEEAFKVPKVTTKVLFILILGPAVIALGDAFGSGEWVFAPAIMVKYGWGVAWLAWILILCQTIYQIFWAKLIVLTGEIPAVFFSRLPGGPKFWSWFVALNHALRIAWPGWALGSATAVAAMILGRTPGAQDRELIQVIAIILFLIVIINLLFGRKIASVIEIVEKALIGFIVVGLLFIVLPLSLNPIRVSEAVIGALSIGYIPKGVDILLLASFVGYIGSALFHNWYNVVYYRDKGFGMGSAVGYIPGLIGGVKVFLSPFGKFPKPTEENVRTFKRWMRIVALDQFLIYFLGCIIGAFIPPLIATSLLPIGTEISGWAVAVYISEAFATKVGPWGFYLVGLIGFSILYTTQLMLSDNLIRNIIEILWSTNEDVRKWARGDVRRLYYTALAIYAAFAISVILSGASPLLILQISAIVPHFMAFWSLPAMIYIEYKLLPKEYRSHPIIWVFMAIMAAISITMFVGLVAWYGFGIKIF